jgi:hypothetical protein
LDFSRELILSCKSWSYLTCWSASSAAVDSFFNIIYLRDFTHLNISPISNRTSLFSNFHQKLLPLWF